MVTFHQHWSEWASTHAQRYQRRHQSIMTREERVQIMKCRSSFLRYFVQHRRSDRGKNPISWNGIKGKYKYLYF